jgi:tetratricopeptide (TPR) repeat protein
MELKSRNVQHARNLFDRAVTLLPRVDQLWYKYVYLEELLQNVPGARQVFERWMQWEPDDKAWQAYIKMEERYGELDRASAIYERWIAVRPEPRVWVKWGKFEEERAKLDKAREVFQTALTFYGDDEEQVEKAQAVFGAFAKMETRLKEYERARVIYKVLFTAILCTRSSQHPSLLSDVSLGPSLLRCTRLTRNSRSSMGRAPLWKALFLASVESNMKRSFPMTAAITMYGLTMPVWRKGLGGTSRTRALLRRRRKLLRFGCGRCMKGRCRRSLQEVRRDIGEDTFSCG